MKLLYFIPRYDASLLGNRIHTDIIEAWRAFGIDTEVVTLASTQRRMQTEQQNGIVVHKLPVSANLPLKLANRAVNAIFHYPYLAGALVCYRHLLRQHHYDLVHVETAFPLGLIAALMPRASHPPLAVTLPGADIMAEPQYDYGYARFAAVRTALPFVLRRADVLRADSPQIRTLAIRFGAPPEKITAIPYNITDDSYPAAGTNIAALRAESRRVIAERHGLDPSRPIIVSVNRLHPFKGFNYLIEAIPHLRRDGIEPQVLIVGPNRSTPRFGDYGAFLQRRAAELGVSDTMTFAGTIPHDQTLQYYAAADVGVVASVAESFSRVAIETTAAGTPVVITRTTGASDYIREGNCGIVVEPRSGEALAQGIAELLKHTQRWRICHEQAPQFAESFRSTTIARRLIDLYQPFIRLAALTN